VHPESVRTRRPIPEIGTPKIKPLLHEIDHPALIKTHYSTSNGEDNYKTVLLVRDGRDVAVSYFNYIKHIIGTGHSDRELMRKICEGRIEFDKWEDHFWHWMVGRTHPPDIVWTFDELISRNKATIIGRTLEALGLSHLSNGKTAIHIAQKEDPPSFLSLHMADPKFFRRGTSGQYKDDPYFHDLFMKHQKGGMDMWDIIQKVPPQDRGTFFRDK
jgi:hypothetical protein